jgi:phosphatidylserine decarboxylase
MPCAGQWHRVARLGSRLWPVNGTSVPWVPQLFVENERAVLLGARSQGTALAMVMVAALGVGHIALAHEELPTPRRGSGVEPPRALSPAWSLPAGGLVGHFDLGSTVVVAVARPAAGRSWVPAGGLEPGQKVRLGELLWRPGPG